MDHTKLMALMAQKKKAMKRGERTVKFKPGKNRIRVAPGWRKGEEHTWYHDFGQHFVKDAADQVQAVYVCTDATYGKPCAVCAALKNAIRLSSDDATSEVLAKSATGKAILINAFHLDSDDPHTPQVTEVKAKAFAQMIEILEENGPEAFFDFNNGHELIVTRDGKGLNTTYSVQMAIKKGTPIPAAAASKINNLDEFVAQESEEQERRAIAALNSVAGLLPAPTAPATSASALTAPATAAIGAPVGAAAAAPAAVGAGEVALDSELDDLLGDLPADGDDGAA